MTLYVVLLCVMHTDKACLVFLCVGHRNRRNVMCELIICTCVGIEWDKGNLEKVPKLST